VTTTATTTATATATTTRARTISIVRRRASVRSIVITSLTRTKKSHREIFFSHLSRRSRRASHGAENQDDREISYFHSRVFLGKMAQQNPPIINRRSSSEFKKSFRAG
jgi:hypothetical protein